jgi:excinuclease ABC subunit B
LDLPEVSLVAILDADKEGFLRSQTALVQTMGRAARHILGEVIMYADTMTGSMERAIEEVTRRREVQAKYNIEHGISPTQIVKPIRDTLIDAQLEETFEEKKTSRNKAAAEIDYSQLPPKELKHEIRQFEKQMKFEAEMLNFEKAASLRDKIKDLYKLIHE